MITGDHPRTATASHRTGDLYGWCRSDWCSDRSDERRKLTDTVQNVSVFGRVSQA
jgi:hypothetical protein